MVHRFILEFMELYPLIYSVQIRLSWKILFFNFSCMFLNPIIFSNLNYNCSNLLDMRKLQEQLKKAFCYQTLFWPFTVWINCSSDLKIFVNSQPSAVNSKSFSQSQEQFIQTVKGQNNFLKQNAFLTFSWRFLLPEKLEQL